MTELTLVLLPGLDGTGIMFRPLLPFLPANLRPIVVSYPPDQPLAYSDLLPIVQASLPDSSPFLLVGESFSGPLALMAARMKPDGLRGVILCASFVKRPVRFAPAWLRHLVFPSLFRFRRARKMVNAMLGGDSTPALRTLTEEALSVVRPEVLAARVRSVLTVDVTRELCSCPVPILYLRGDRDRVVARHNADTIAAANPSVEVVEVPAPHLIFQCLPEEAAAAISAFSNKVILSAP
jgi:pimeloyl-ACP methyl ester carboxylesterase